MAKLFLLNPGDLFRYDCKAYRLLAQKGGKSLCLDTNEEVSIPTMTEVEPISAEEVKKCCGKRKDCEKAEAESKKSAKKAKLNDDEISTGELKGDSSD